jgi:glycosyltransferase involved in cell wall biosynthesis
MKEQNINLKVVFSGLDRGNKKYLLEQVKDLDLENEVIFLDYVNQKQLATLYKNAYALVYPCLAGPDSISALEALYFNCPVLISNHLGYTQQLKKAALYFNPLDEIDIVSKIQDLNDLAVKDDLINKGQALIKENTAQKYIDKFLNVMDSFYLTRQCWSLKESYRSK